MAQPFLIYVALIVVAAVVVVIVTGAEHLSRTAHRQIEQPYPTWASDTVSSPYERQLMR